MFGRRRDDEEYIAPVEEYRDDGEYSDEYNGYSGGDCADHSHGASYKVKEYRDDCSDHTHGQTYKDYNAEQSGYDRASDLKSRFTAILEPGENIVWMGETNRSAKISEKGTPALMRAVWFWWIGMSILMFIVMLITGDGLFAASGVIPFAVFGLAFRFFGGDVNRWSYAITDRRVITLKKYKAVSDYFGNIRNVRQYSSKNNRGYISYQKVKTTLYGRIPTTTTTVGGIFGIDQPFAVYQTLIDTMSYRKAG